MSYSNPERVVLVIPCYNEADRLPVADLTAEAHRFYAIVLVDDCSTDATAEVLDGLADSLASSGTGVHVHRIEQNAGKGEAVRQGVCLARSLYSNHDIAFTDADLSTPLREMERIGIECARRNVDVLQGSRVALAGRMIERSRIRHWVGRVAQTLISELLDLEIYDTQAGAKVFRAGAVDRLFERPFVSRWLFDCEIFLRARELGYLVEEEPLREWRQVSGSKVRIFTYLSALSDLIRIKLRYRR